MIYIYIKITNNLKVLLRTAYARAARLTQWKEKLPFSGLDVLFWLTLLLLEVFSLILQFSPVQYQ